jgi:hypothetical protein
MTTITLDPQPDSPTKCFSADALRDRGVARVCTKLLSLRACSPSLRAAANSPRQKSTQMTSDGCSDQCC